MFSRSRFSLNQYLESWYGHGHLMFVQALYLRDLPDKTTSVSPVLTNRIKTLKLASLAEVFGMSDFAKIILLDKEAKEAIDFLASGKKVHLSNYVTLVKTLTKTMLHGLLPQRLRHQLKSFVKKLVPCNGKIG